MTRSSSVQGIDASRFACVMKRDTHSAFAIVYSAWMEAQGSATMALGVVVLIGAEMEGGNACLRLWHLPGAALGVVSRGCTARSG